jgi:hypothetical protein
MLNSSRLIIKGHTKQGEVFIPKDYSRQEKKWPSAESSEKEISTGKDFFIIVAGLMMVVMIFFLYRVMTTVDLEVIFPTKGSMVMDERGRPVEKSPEKLSEQSVHQIIVIGSLCFAMSISIFVFLMILFYWPKKNRPRNNDHGR